MRYLILFLIYPLCLFAQKSDCLQQSIIDDNFYIRGNKLYSGYISGNIDFYIDIDDSSYNANNLVMFIYEKDKNQNKIPLVGAACHNIVKAKNKGQSDKLFRLKRLLSVSDKQGRIIIPYGAQLELIAITYPSYNAEIIDYKELVECVKNN